MHLYNGQNFRFPDELRWGLFFDACGIQYDYFCSPTRYICRHTRQEIICSGFCVQDVHYDFALPLQELFLFVKGGGDIFKKLNLLLIGALPHCLADFETDFHQTERTTWPLYSTEFIGARLNDYPKAFPLPDRERPSRLILYTHSQASYYDYMRGLTERALRQVHTLSLASVSTLSAADIREMIQR